MIHIEDCVIWFDFWEVRINEEKKKNEKQGKALKKGNLFIQHATQSGAIEKSKIEKYFSK